MNGLRELLAKCDKDMFTEIVEDIVCMFQEELHYFYLHHANGNGEHLDDNDVKMVVRKSLANRMRKELRQQEIDRSSFAVVVGGREGSKRAVKHTHRVADATGRARSSTQRAPLLSFTAPESFGRMSATELKNHGNVAFSAGNCQEAIDLYTKVACANNSCSIKMSLQLTCLP